MVLTVFRLIFLLCGIPCGKNTGGCVCMGSILESANAKDIVFARREAIQGLAHAIP